MRAWWCLILLSGCLSGPDAAPPTPSEEPDATSEALVWADCEHVRMHLSIDEDAVAVPDGSQPVPGSLPGTVLMWAWSFSCTDVAATVAAIVLEDGAYPFWAVASDPLRLPAWLDAGTGDTLVTILDGFQSPLNLGAGVGVARVHGQTTLVGDPTHPIDSSLHPTDPVRPVAFDVRFTDGVHATNLTIEPGPTHTGSGPSRTDGTLPWTGVLVGEGIMSSGSLDGDHRRDVTWAT